MSLIFKNLWFRRRRNGWLMAELILVTIISWVVLDPVIVLTHDRMLPMGFDDDRLCVVSLAELSPKSADYVAPTEESPSPADTYLGLVRAAENFEGVEMAVPLCGFCYPGSDGDSNYPFTAQGDTIPHHARVIYFPLHARFFEAFGFEAVAGGTAAQLSELDTRNGGTIITEDLAIQLYGSTDVVGRRYSHYVKGHNPDSTSQPVLGVVKDFKYRKILRNSPAAFITQPVPEDEISEDAKILIRLKPDVNPKRFVEDFRPWMVKELRSGNLYARSVMTYTDMMSIQDEKMSRPVYRTNILMAVFFLINLCLGVVGTFWLQTRTRREEIGVMLTFGATPNRIVRMLMSEGAVLTIISALIGFGIYLIYALNEGLSNGAYRYPGFPSGRPAYLIEDFTFHFCFVSAVILIITLIVVMLGIWLPARHISRVPPTEALKDE